MRRLLRETAFRVARRDLALFLEEHEEDLLQAFREELQRLDDEIHEESLFLDIKMVPLGETFLKAALRAIRRFLNQETSPAVVPATPSSSDQFPKKA